MGQRRTYSQNGKSLGCNNNNKANNIKITLEVILEQ
jgi:hypothetical protein